MALSIGHASIQNNKFIKTIPTHGNTSLVVVHKCCEMATHRNIYVSQAFTNTQTAHLRCGGWATGGNGCHRWATSGPAEVCYLGISTFRNTSLAMVLKTIGVQASAYPYRICSFKTKGKPEQKVPITVYIIMIIYIPLRLHLAFNMFNWKLIEFHLLEDSCIIYSWSEINP